MHEPNIPTVSQTLAYFLAFISILPIYILLNVKSIDSYRSFFNKIPWMKQYINSRAKIAPNPAIALGLLIGILVCIVMWYGSKKIDFDIIFKPKSSLSWTIQIAFILSALIEEVLKNSFALLFAFLFMGIVKNQRDSNSGRIFSRSVPFIFGGTGLGFAFIENAGYLEGIPISNIAALLFVRGVVSSTVHVAINFNFGLTMLGVNSRNFFKVAFFSYIIAILQHGIFNFFALSSEPLPKFIAHFIMILWAFIALYRMYEKMPETKYRSLRKKEETQGDDKKEDKGTVSPGFAFMFVLDSHSHIRPGLQRPPFHFMNFPLDRSIIDLLSVESHRGTVPERLIDEWDFFESATGTALLESGSLEMKVWDSSVLSGVDNRMFEKILENGIDLTRLKPLRVLEFSPSFTQIWNKNTNGTTANCYIYLSCGLKSSIGRELWISFPHINQSIRWFFLNLAQHDSLYFKEFTPVPVDSKTLGDLMNHYTAILPVPLFDPLRERLKEELKQGAVLPLQILYLQKSDYEFIQKHGAQAYFDVLKELDYSWNNDYHRPGLDRLIEY